MFELWIDRWVAVNYSLPSAYDKYKAEAIKSETNLSELFGSVERMVILYNQGLFTKNIFLKYKDIWPFVTEIPVNTLQMIVDGNYENALEETIRSFENSFINHDFQKAWWLMASNSWFSQIYDDLTYRILIGCFNKYREDMMHTGHSNIFIGINSINNLVERFSSV